jgi:hypothetical protein
MISEELRKKRENIVFLILALLLLGYTASRAYILSFTFDESYSYTSYVKDSYKNIISYHFLTSNNHALNSVLMKLSTEIFAPSDFTLRLHSILGHVFFLLFSWLILKNIRISWYKFGIFILLNFNPFVLDFFSLARGYGLAMGLMIASLYFLKQYIESATRKYLCLVLSILTAAVACTANFTMLNYTLGLMVVILIFSAREQFVHQRKNFLWKSSGLMLLTAAPFLAYILKITFKLNAAKELYYGGRVGIWIDTVSTLIDSTLYHKHYLINARLFLQVSIICLLSFGLVFTVTRFLVKRESLQSYLFFLSVVGIFVFILAGVELQHVIFRTYFLVDRTAMLLIPLFVLSAGCLMYYLYQWKKFTAFLMILYAGMSLIHFGYAMNFYTTETWPEQADIKKMMIDLDKIRLAKDPAKTDYFLCPFWQCGPAADFYRQVFNYSWLEKVEVRPPKFKENYFFYPDSERFELGSTPVKVIKRYPDTKSVLLENLNPTKRELIESGALPLEPGDTCLQGVVFVPNKGRPGYSVVLKPGVFSPGLKFKIGQLKGDSFYRVEASAWIYFDHPDKRGGELVISASDSSKLYEWTSEKFIRYFDLDGHWMHVYFGDWMPKVRTSKDVVTVSVFNNSDNITFYVDRIEAKVIK